VKLQVLSLKLPSGGLCMVPTSQNRSISRSGTVVAVLLCCLTL
jgi:hypothetical protein